MFTPFEKNPFHREILSQESTFHSVHLLISRLYLSSMSVRTDDQHIIIIIRTSSFLYFISIREIANLFTENVSFQTSTIIICENAIIVYSAVL